MAIKLFLVICFSETERTNILYSAFILQNFVSGLVYIWFCQGQIEYVSSTQNALVFVIKCFFVRIHAIIYGFPINEQNFSNFPTQQKNKGEEEIFWVGFVQKFQKLSNFRDSSSQNILGNSRGKIDRILQSQWLI